jgi:hypothetical protein
MSIDGRENLSMINYDGKRFQPVEAAEQDRVAVYRQVDDLLWGEFRGGHARLGTLAGRCESDGILEFAYCMVLDDGQVISGHCRSTPTVLDDGRIQLDEAWERYGTERGSGTSRLVEIAA